MFPIYLYSWGAALQEPQLKSWGVYRGLYPWWPRNSILYPPAPEDFQKTYSDPQAVTCLGNQQLSHREKAACLPVYASLLLRVLIPQVLATLPSDNICNMLPSFSSYFQQRRWYQVSLLYLETEILEMSKKIEYRDLLSGGLDDRLM